MTAYHRKLSETIECFPVQVVHLTQVGIRHNHEWEVLHVSDPLSDAYRQLLAHKVCGPEDLVRIAAERAPEEEELTEREILRLLRSPEIQRAGKGNSMVRTALAAGYEGRWKGYSRVQIEMTTQIRRAR